MDNIIVFNNRATTESHGAEKYLWVSEDQKSRIFLCHSLFIKEYDDLEEMKKEIGFREQNEGKVLDEIADIPCYFLALAFPSGNNSWYVALADKKGELISEAKTPVAQNIAQVLAEENKSEIARDLFLTTDHEGQARLILLSLQKIVLLD